MKGSGGHGRLSGFQLSPTENTTGNSKYLTGIGAGSVLFGLSFEPVVMLSVLECPGRFTCNGDEHTRSRNNTSSQKHSKPDCASLAGIIVKFQLPWDKRRKPENTSTNIISHSFADYEAVAWGQDSQIKTQCGYTGNLSSWSVITGEISPLISACGCTGWCSRIAENSNIFKRAPRDK